jgi:hypothetical protein
VTRILDVNRAIRLATAAAGSLLLVLAGPAGASEATPGDGEGLPGTALKAIDPTPPKAGVSVSGPLSRADVPYSYRPGCPVAPSQLRRVSLLHVTFDGKIERGSVIVRKDAVSDVKHVLSTAFKAGFPIFRMTPVDAFYAKGKVSPSRSDVRAMEANNTSAFNCRPVTGNPYRLSTHSVGIAIDINPRENPYVTSSHVYPDGSRTFLNRSDKRKGMIVKGGVIAKTMAARGWPWGARWSHPDYQHFSANGG